MSRLKPGVKVREDFDQTQLKLTQFKYQPHKDYLGHVFRWGFASRFVNTKTTVLDVGCGQEMPFARSLGGANPNSVPRLYVGVDLNKIKNPITRKNFVVFDEFNFIKKFKDITTSGIVWCSNAKPTKKGILYDLIVNFEVFEHMPMAQGRKLLRAMKYCLADKGRLVFSTPVYSDQYKMARNHINELTKAEMEKELHRCGFAITHQYGTFGNYRDIKKMLTKDEIKSYEKMRQFYGDEILGCYLSPRFPEAARNITHVCVHEESDAERCELKPSIVK